MKKVAATEAKAKLSEFLAQVASDGQPILIERHGKPAAALVSVQDLALIGDARPSAPHPLGALALLGAWKALTDAEIDDFIDTVYQTRSADLGRPVELEV